MDKTGEATGEPVFFVQDAIKFLDMVHAAKPEPHHEMPRASTTHHHFWDFISLMPDGAHTSADDILASIARFALRTSETGH